ncbi:M48 family metalloprotease [Leptolyngbya sp. FACHB-321]|uniref:M48 family metalloprotease n=1 Tax=Leptolyngbya sp. FACHB-321 TaxID=2692807 RepID=UPI00168450A7|nr:M48 family metalloprotease [Leptolyngbya sp. FACHB-321]MBD2036802.1 M48 family metalloprotease [Leptolyngbya sp. FACHB-321]
MPPVPDPSPIAHDSDLEAGLSALKQGDYKTAIAKLEAAPLLPQHPLTAKAQMGLVVAYARTGEPLRAAALCQTLQQSETPEVSEWASKTLASLAERYPQVDQLQDDRLRDAQLETGPDLAATPSSSSLASDNADLTGFTPFDPTAPPTFTDDRSGFTPFDPAALHPQSSEPQAVDGGSEQPDVVLPKVNRSTANAEETAVRLEGQNISKVRSPAVSSGKKRPQGTAAAIASNPSQPTALEEPQSLYQAVWRQAGRLKQGKSLGKVKLLHLLLLQAGTAIALFWMVQTIAYYAAFYYRIALTAIPFLNIPHQIFGPPVVPVLVLLVVLFIASRWLLDGLLTTGYGLQPLTLSKLATYSPETAQSLQRFCRQQGIPIPTLGLLPTAAPLAFSYGCLPRVTRTVVSQGLLEQLADDEIATIYASEVGHISRFNVPLLSLVMVLMQIPYTIYWQVSVWGDRKQAAISRFSASLIAAVSYGVYALIRWTGLWLARQRVYYSDRVAAELTGNPNGFTRALLKLAIGTAKEAQTQKQTSYLLEGFDLLLPLGQRMATTIGSVYPYAPIESVLAWERTNPYRHWLAINNSHPPTGDRLHLLTVYARHWQLETELEWSQPTSKKITLTARQWRTLLLQGAPFFGLVFSFVFAYLLETLGWYGMRSNLSQLSWMYGDRALLHGLPLIGFSIGTFIRINPLFPDVPFSNAKTDRAATSLVPLLMPADQVPVDGRSVQLEGKLLGRRSLSNLLSQDLLLQTTTGIVRLHWLSTWGPIGNLLTQAVRPTALLNQDVVVTGWFRRGATPWIDVETIRTAGGRVSRSGHPIWSTILGTIAAAWGLYILFRVGFF